ncbi:hypothetical protein [Rhizobium phage RHEph12]|nr:hypothetical protein [Rhizobium phage RHEph12]
MSTYADNMLSAIHHENKREYLLAAKRYGEALYQLLFESMLPITDATVQGVNEARLLCYRFHRERNQ